MQPDTTTELTDSRDTITSNLLAWLPPGVDVAATDSVHYDGRTYSIDGEPARWVDLYGVEDHVELRLRLVKG